MYSIICKGHSFELKYNHDCGIVVEREVNYETTSGYIYKKNK